MAKLGYFGHLEHKNDLVLACRNMGGGAVGKGRGRKTMSEVGLEFS